MYKVRVQSNSGRRIYAAQDGHPSDWTVFDRPEPEARLVSIEDAIALVAQVVSHGYARAWVEEILPR